MSRQRRRKPARAGEVIAGADICVFDVDRIVKNGGARSSIVEGVGCGVGAWRARVRTDDSAAAVVARTGTRFDHNI